MSVYIGCAKGFPALPQKSKVLFRGCLKSHGSSPEPPLSPPILECPKGYILGGSEVKVRQNLGLKAFQSYTKRGQVQGLKHF